MFTVTDGPFTYLVDPSPMPDHIVITKMNHGVFMSRETYPRDIFRKAKDERVEQMREQLQTIKALAKHHPDELVHYITNL